MHNPAKIPGHPAAARMQAVAQFGGRQHAAADKMTERNKRLKLVNNLEARQRLPGPGRRRPTDKGHVDMLSPCLRLLQLANPGAYGVQFASGCPTAQGAPFYLAQGIQAELMRQR